MAIERDRALIWRRFTYGESSLVVHALSAAHGRVHLLAKGAYRPTSRYYAALDLFDTLELEWAHAPSRELQNLREATIVTRRIAIARDLGRYRAALAMLELCGMAAREAQPARELFATVEGALDRLADARSSHERELTRFELRFLADVGLAPALRHCAACGRSAPSPAPANARSAFSSGAGGRLCRRCAQEARASGRSVASIATATLELAAALAGDEIEHRAISKPELEKVRAFVVRFLEYHLESRPKSYRRPLEPNRR